MKNQPYFTLKTKLFLILLIAFSFINLNAQKQPNVAQQKILNQAQSFESLKSENPLSKLSTISASERSKVEKGIDIDKAIFLSIDNDISSELVEKRSDNLVINLPYEGSTTVELQLIKSKVLTEEFKVYAGSDKNTPIDYKHGAHYWGIAKGDPNSMVAISFYEDEIVGTLKFHGKSYDLGRIGSKGKTLFFMKTRI